MPAERSLRQSPVNDGFAGGCSVFRNHRSIFSFFVLKGPPKLRPLLIMIGSLLIPLGLFSDFSWLKRLGDACTSDGDCTPCTQLLHFSWASVPLLGAILLVLVFKGYRTPEKGGNRLETFTAVAIFVLLLFYLAASQLRYLDNDEYEHLHNAWMMKEGTIPFFSLAFTHTPLLEWVILAPMKILGESVLIIQGMRLLVFFVSCCSLCVVYLIAKEIYDSRIHAFVSVLLLLGNLVWIMNSFEVRPDNLMVFFALASFLFMMRFLKTGSYLQLAFFAGSALLSLLGKQNAAVFLSGLALAFGSGLLLDRERSRNWRLLTVAAFLAGSAALLQIDFVRTSLWINISRHLVPNEIKFFPTEFLLQIWKVTPAVFLLFLFEMFRKSSTGVRAAKRYLYIVSFVSLLFLFLMNRPFSQEMLMMVAVMSIAGSNFLVLLMQNADRKHAGMILALIAVPALVFIGYTTLNKPAYPDIAVTETILGISKKSDLVFDAYGKAIFRHSPLEPRYLVYSPEKFKRSEKLKSSDTKYILKDTVYYPRLPGDLRGWIEDNFVQAAEHPSILVRKIQTGER
jgi:hypothetical protein